MVADLDRVALAHSDEHVALSVVRDGSPQLAELVGILPVKSVLVFATTRLMAEN